MQYLFEYCDKLKSPYEAFYYDSSCMPDLAEIVACMVSPHFFLRDAPLL